MPAKCGIWQLEKCGLGFATQQWASEEKRQQKKSRELDCRALGRGDVEFIVCLSWSSGTVQCGGLSLFPEWTAQQGWARWGRSNPVAQDKWFSGELKSLSLQVLKQLHGFHAFPSIHWSLSSFFSPAQNPLSLFYSLHPHLVYNTISFRTTIPSVNVLTELHLSFHVVQGLCSVSPFVNRYWWRMEQKLGTACSWKPGTSSLR